MRIPSPECRDWIVPTASCSDTEVPIGTHPSRGFGRLIFMPNVEHPRRDAGSRGLSVVLRHPVVSFTALFRDGSSASETDRSAAWSSKGIAVSCFLRGAFDPLPRSFKQGHLILSNDAIQWGPGIRRRTPATTLPTPIRIVRVREVEAGEKMKRSLFGVVEVATDLGEVALGIPKDSVALVVDRLRAE